MPLSQTGHKQCSLHLASSLCPSLSLFLSLHLSPLFLSLALLTYPCSSILLKCNGHKQWPPLTLSVEQKNKSIYYEGISYGLQPMNHRVANTQTGFKGESQINHHHWCISLALISLVTDRLKCSSPAFSEGLDIRPEPACQTG